MSTNFRDFVEEVERNADPEERRLLEESRRRFGIGSKLLERRMAVGMSQRELAAASGVDQAEISRIERGQSNPTAQTLQALGEPLGVTLDFSPASAS
ncbi:MAG TPA: helix-turn-helix transcriptional regulator [Solirubrobacteraceae bacterium]|nr:helix-turn-helix transcriptional regulator [Solirubrobacteraceae bacterium]